MIKWQDKDKKLTESLNKAIARKHIENKHHMASDTLLNKDNQNHGEVLNELVVNGEININVLHKSPSSEEVKVEAVAAEPTEDIKSKEDLLAANEIKAVLNEVVNIQSTDEISKVLENIFEEGALKPPKDQIMQ
jgi:hypothetical protein